MDRLLEKCIEEFDKRKISFKVDYSVGNYTIILERPHSSEVLGITGYSDMKVHISQDFVSEPPTHEFPFGEDKIDSVIRRVIDWWEDGSIEFSGVPESLNPSL